MCGRYLVDDDAADTIEMWMNSLTGGLPNYTTGEVFPTNIAAVLTQNGPEAVKWGFPHWQNSSVIINARSETALNSNMFRKPLQNQRCVIPSSGFYEWSAVPGTKKKDKHLLRITEDEMLFMAGMYNTFHDKNGNEYSAFVILTTDAHESIAHIHNRMPLLLLHDENDLWLGDNSFMEFALNRPGPELISKLV
ncbi:MAG: SOS response-associated peptidase [Oscillospiraceae bacterium]|nr:SOS response-associated peptidase [Oscillospiraceae bacterium]